MSAWAHLTPSQHQRHGMSCAPSSFQCLSISSFNTFIKWSSSHVVEAQSCVHIVYVLQKSEEALHLLKRQPLGQRKDSLTAMGKGDCDTTWIMNDKMTHQSKGVARGEFICTLKIILLWPLRIWFATCTFVNHLCSPPGPTSCATGKDFVMHGQQWQRPKSISLALAMQPALAQKSRHTMSLWLGCRRLQQEDSFIYFF